MPYVTVVNLKCFRASFGWLLHTIRWKSWFYGCDSICRYLINIQIIPFWILKRFPWWCCLMVISWTISKIRKFILFWDSVILPWTLLKVSPLVTCFSNSVNRTCTRFWELHKASSESAPCLNETRTMYLAALSSLVVNWYHFMAAFSSSVIACSLSTSLISQNCLTSWSIVSPVAINDSMSGYMICEDVWANIIHACRVFTTKGGPLLNSGNMMSLRVIG